MFPALFTLSLTSLMKEQIWQQIAAMHTPGFFITAQVVHEDSEYPQTLAAFITAKLAMIRQGSSARKFAFTEKSWRIYITFFPTDRVVDERYALKNQAVKFKRS